MVKRRQNGYVLIILMMAVLVLAIGLTVAVPVLETELRREKEEELIFRGRQYVEAVRLFQLNNPGRFPESIKQLLDAGYLRKPFTDPMTASGEWDIVLNPGAQAGGRQGVARVVHVVPLSALESVSNPIILGVVSSSTKQSIRLYEEQTSYDKWLFFYGNDPKNPPKIVYPNREEEGEGAGENE